MPRYPLQGVSALSQLTIDADKDWQTRGITNLKELAAAMAFGDLVARGPAGILVRIPAGAPSLFLTGAGAALPYWGPGGLYLNRYIPASLYSAWGTVVVIPDHTYNKNAPLTSSYVANYDDDTNMERVDATVGATDAQNVIAAATHSNDEPSPYTRNYDLQQVLEGAVAEDTPATADETAAAKNATVNDMTLLPAAPANNDAYYFGSSYKFDNLLLNIGIQGVGVWTYIWEYYDVDTTWHALAGVTDGTVGFTAAAGIKTVSFTKDANWTAVAVGGIGPFYWIRCRILVYTSIVTQPKGTQAWYRIIT